MRTFATMALGAALLLPSFAHATDECLTQHEKSLARQAAQQDLFALEQQLGPSVHLTDKQKKSLKETFYKALTDGECSCLVTLAL